LKKVLLVSAAVVCVICSVFAIRAREKALRPWTEEESFVEIAENDIITVTPIPETLTARSVKVEVKNCSEERLHYEIYPRIQVMRDGKWYDIVLKDPPSLPCPDYNIGPGETIVEGTLLWSADVRQPDGTYRLVKTYGAGEDPTEAVKNRKKIVFLEYECKNGRITFKE